MFLLSATGREWIGPTRVCAGESFHGVLGVSWDWIAARVELRGAIRIKLPGSYGEKLHQLAGVIFVGMISLAGIGLVVVHHVEPMAHGGRQSDVIHDLAIIGKCVGIQQAEIICVAGGVVDFIAADDKNLAQRKGHSLAQLIRRKQDLYEETLLHRAESLLSC